jgi:hypothetical protein
MNPLVPKLISAAVSVIAARASKENLKHPTTMAAAASATAAVAASEVLPTDSPEALITQAVLAVLSVILFFYPPRKPDNAGKE